VIVFFELVRQELRLVLRLHLEHLSSSRLGQLSQHWTPFHLRHSYHGLAL